MIFFHSDYTLLYEKKNVINQFYYRFTDVVAKWPGSTHDATVFENSGIKHFLHGNNHGFLLGDSGYALRPYLITPVQNPGTPAENHFNYIHSKTRMVVERAFGVLKSRFR